MYSEIDKCRISQSESLVSVLNLGQQALTGVFPKTAAEQVPLAPLELVWCPVSGLVQLKHSVEPGEMYGDNYGYRSGLNPTMVKHLQRKTKWLEDAFQPGDSDLVLDIGANDGTLLNSYRSPNLVRIGFDPVAKKYLDLYDDNIKVIADFFSRSALSAVSSKKAKIITSIAMVYDLEDPVGFVGEIADSLHPDGVWHFEQSYLPAMLRTNSYDTICHEHLEYYSLSVIQNILALKGMKVLDVQTNSVNGGSFAVTAALEKSPHPVNAPVIEWLLRQEKNLELDTSKPYDLFRDRVFQHRDDLRALVKALNDEGKTVVAYGASTKGNVLLQFCGFGPEDISCVAEVNPEKFGSFTPGSRIPILSEEDVRAMKPDYMLVLPWHFKEFIVEKENEFLEQGGRLIFPLPEIEIVS